MTESCKPIKVLVTPDCTQCYKTTLETIPYNFNSGTPLNYVTFPTDPNADDLHFGWFNDYIVAYRYTGTVWQVEGYRLSIAEQQTLDWVNILNKPTTFPPSNHTHSTYESQILALQNEVDAVELEIDGIQTDISTLAIVDISGLQGALDTLQDNIDLVPGDDWGSQVVEKTSAFTGNGTLGTPLGLADNAVTNTKIADLSISTTKIIDGQITNLKLGNNSVTTAKITDLNVTTDKLIDNAVTTAKITDLNVNSVKLAADSVITSKILDLNVTTAKIAANAVTVAKLPAGAVAGTVLTGAGTWLYPPLIYLESILASGTLVGNASWVSFCNITLTPGTWLATAQITAFGDVETNFIIGMEHGVGGTLLTETYGFIPILAGSTNSFNNLALTKIVTVGVNTTLSLRAKGEENSFRLRNTNNATYLSAVRIA